MQSKGPSTDAAIRMNDIRAARNKRLFIRRGLENSPLLNSYNYQMSTEKLKHLNNKIMKLNKNAFKINCTKIL